MEKESLTGYFRYELLMRTDLRGYNKQGMQLRSGNTITTRSGPIATLEELHLLNSPTLIGDVLMTCPLPAVSK